MATQGGRTTDEGAKATSAVPRILQRRKSLERDLAHITQEMYKRNRELTETNKTLTLLRTIDTLVLESQQPLQAVCQQIAETVATTTEFPFVAVLTKSAHREATMQLMGWHANTIRLDAATEAALNGLHVDINNLWYTSAEKSKVIAIGERHENDIAAALSITKPMLRTFRQALPVASLYAVKLRARNKLVGIIVAGFYAPPAELSEWDTLLLDRLSEGVGIVLDNKLLFEENRHVLQQLQHTNEKLKALDETKDDFISMASHQLRTPLTSVKGYLSMVLDGDAGTITPMQKKMLGQAFMSSQRMVFLIADLLNVSRLKTGKFVIEPSRINLADLIHEEIGQVEEMAAGRSLELTYDKPKNFPDLMLDETKTRQVVMNFIDNAIHYTPTGGHIKVELHNKPKTIELLVKDDGIGVSKTEQHHLFTKFYRVVNARRERPDGTGLGLFMVKKVVVAQGGAVIFNSKENKGSTFGFTMPKDKLLPPV